MDWTEPLPKLVWPTMDGAFEVLEGTGDDLGGGGGAVVDEDGHGVVAWAAFALGGFVGWGGFGIRRGLRW